MCVSSLRDIDGGSERETETKTDRDRQSETERQRENERMVCLGHTLVFK